MLPEANAFRLAGSNEAAILVHGLTGSPAQLRPLGEAMHETFGWEIVGLLLPGHGTTIQDLSEKTAEDWMKSVNEAVTILSGSFERVHLVGLSMGALLCLEVFRNDPAKIGSLVLLAPPLWLRSLKENLLAHLLPKIPLPKSLTIWRKAGPVLPGYVGYDHLSVPAVGQFLGLCRRARSLPRIDSVPSLLIFSEADETAHPKSGRFLAQRLTHPGSKVVCLEKAEHVLTLSSEKERVRGEVISFYRGVISPF